MSWQVPTWGSPDWMPVALALAAVAAAALVWTYSRAPASGALRAGCATLKALAFAEGLLR